LTPNADWWPRVRILLPKRVWALRKGGHEAAIDIEAVPGIGAEIVLTVDGEWRRSRLFRSHEQAEQGRRDCRYAGDVRGEGVGVKLLRPSSWTRLRRRMMSEAGGQLRWSRARF
jgi:hypothetical protein